MKYTNLKLTLVLTLLLSSLTCFSAENNKSNPLAKLLINKVDVPKAAFHWDYHFKRRVQDMRTGEQKHEFERDLRICMLKAEDIKLLREKRINAKAMSAPALSKAEHIEEDLVDYNDKTTLPKINYILNTFESPFCQDIRNGNQKTAQPSHSIDNTSSPIVESTQSAQSQTGVN